MQTLSKDELKKMNEVSEDDFVLINVLKPDAFNDKHIRTSINIPYSHPDSESLVELVSGGTKDRNIVVYCGSFQCKASTTAAEKLDKAGFKKVYDYEGGTADWFED